MNVKIGSIIKKLRTEKNVTQDALASAIGVTPQAVSRWESEGGYPDIELLPVLADFFSVSTDELLGYKFSEREAEIGKTKKEMERLSEVGTVEEQVAFARSAFSRYPSDHEIRENLAVCLFFLWEDTHNDSLVSEIENLCNSVIAECSDDDTRCDAITTLITLYGENGQSDKAMEAVKLLTPMKYCRELAKACGIGDGNTELYIQEEIETLTDCLGTAIRALAVNEDVPNDPSTWDKKIEMLSVSNALYKMIYGENLMYHHNRLAQNYWLISTYQMSQGKKKEALASLEEMCVHAVEYDKSYISDHGKSFTSIFTDKIIYPEPSRDFHELKEHSDCYYKLDRLQSPRYASIRNHPRFIDVVNRLSEYAK